MPPTECPIHHILCETLINPLTYALKGRCNCCDLLTPFMYIHYTWCQICIVPFIITTLLGIFRSQKFPTLANNTQVTLSHLQASARPYWLQTSS